MQYTCMVHMNCDKDYGGKTFSYILDVKMHIVLYIGLVSSSRAYGYKFGIG